MARTHKFEGIFANQERLERLSDLNDPLERLNRTIDWEVFSAILDAAFVTDYSKGGRPPYNRLLMFKILILQKYYDLSDDRAEYQILDRLTFMRFLGLGLEDAVPDSKTIWNFREQLCKMELHDKLFTAFGEQLQKRGMIVNQGRIIDASFAEAPRQRNSRDENGQLKKGEIPSEWSENKLRQKDTEASWTKKNNQVHFGYKNHVKIDSESKLICSSTVTPASNHDIDAVDVLITEQDRGQAIWADSAYHKDRMADLVEEYDLDPQICEQGYRNKPLTPNQRRNNREKSRTRCRVEHVFGFMTMSMKRRWVRSIGLARAECNITLQNLVYNLFRTEQLIRLQQK